MKPGDRRVVIDGADAIIAASALRHRADDVRRLARPHPNDDAVIARTRDGLIDLGASYERVADRLDPRGKRA